MSVANHRCAFRPARGGTLIFQPDTNEAGTLGMALTSDGTDRWLLTARHVLARANGMLVATDRVLQPNPANGAIATLAGALDDAVLDGVAVKLLVGSADEILGIGATPPAIAPVAGTRVIKSGWKTGVSEGRIQQVLGDDVVIERLPGYPLDYLLASLGDSGAIWLDAATRAPVALHRRESAVGPHLAFGTSLVAILAALHLQQA